ncbi:hypothetical protein [Aquamicrobium zhengzhouense]|uniref:Replication protein n=1 Tax=Aquamicrobium zhengzhouense TaxID=2781738 RepID=A0ABS0SAM0_9HYPH|nr:hypothetical protein [Aquamicrobium zhengzhouense]MBI1620340.1 hypothetical protein [Aquamicrobium zhengzhouense]
MTRRKITKADETPEFIAFWDMWRPKARHNDGRGLARDTFFKHVEQGADPQDIVDGAAYFLRGIKDRQYIPLASTWLNRQAYEDFAEQEREFQARRAERMQPQASNVTVLRPRTEAAPTIDAEARRRHFESLRAQNPLLAGGDW